MKRLVLSFLALCLIAAGAQAWAGRAAAPVGEIAVGALPAGARATLASIKAGGPFAYAKDGSVFGNRERTLPRRQRGYYHEYTVPTPGAGDRGARRIVAGVPGEYYYSDDHYNSFRRIRE